MAFAHVTNDTIHSIGRLPRAARRLDDERWADLRDGDTTKAAACGYFEVTDTARPADTGTTTHDRSVELVDGTPTVVWTERAKSQDELDAEQRTANEAQIRQAVRGRLGTLRTIRDSNGPLNDAQLSNAVRTLAQNQAQIIRLLVNELDGTD